ncbi:MAG: DUF2442 domain-containing protein [Rhodomicrobium sp.]
MLSKPDAGKNRSAAVIPPIVPKARWRVASVEALPDYRLKVRFLDGLEGSVDMNRLIFSPEAGVFAALSDAALFGQVYLEFGAVTWPGEIDLAPDAMYREIQSAGNWTP